MPTNEHYVWAGGHILLLFTSLRYLFAYVMFRAGPLTWWYKTAYTGALVSYAIVCRKAFFSPATNQQTGSIATRALADENVQYLGLALFWWISKPVPLSLVPFATFSLFHTLTFLRSNILPNFFPPTAPATAGGAPQQHPTLKRLQGWIKANYDPAMRVVAYAEVLVLVRVILGALLFQNSLLTPVIYTQFLRMRYYQSAFTQRAFAHAGRTIDGFVRRPGIPPIVVTAWDKFQSLLTRWSGHTLQPQQPVAAGAR